MIKLCKCPSCEAQLMIHSKTTVSRCPDCREKFLIRDSQEPHFEEATKIFIPEDSKVYKKKEIDL